MQCEIYRWVEWCLMWQVNNFGNYACRNLTPRRPARQENGSCKQTIFHTNKLTWFFKSFEGHSSRFVQRHFIVVVEMYVVTSGKISLKSVLQTSVKCQIKPIKKRSRLLFLIIIFMWYLFGFWSLTWIPKLGQWPLLQNQR